MSVKISIESGPDSLIIGGLKAESDYRHVEQVMRNISNKSNHSLVYRRRFEEGIIEIRQKMGCEFRTLVEEAVRSMIRRSIVAVVEEFEMGPLADRLRLGKPVYDPGAASVWLVRDPDTESIRYLEEHEYMLDAQTGTIIFTGTAGKVSGSLTVRYFTEMESLGDPDRMREAKEYYEYSDDRGETWREYIYKETRKEDYEARPEKQRPEDPSPPAPADPEMSERFGRPLRRIMLDK
jgi:hypothetical protein